MRKSLHLAAQNPPSHNNGSTLCETLLHAGMIIKKKKKKNLGEVTVNLEKEKISRMHKHLPDGR